jgi:ATP-dependent helicase/nuclease subunit A
LADVIPFPTRRPAPAATAEQLRASDPTVCAWVAASAGSGKTQVLRDRVLRLLLSGARPTGILCLTFTRAAAAEMANRIANRLRDWAVSEEAALIKDLEALIGAPPTRGTVRNARRLFARVLDAPGGMRIETIHAFCQSLLRRFPLEAGVAPHFRLIEDREQALLEFEARESMLVAARSGQSQPLTGALARVVSRMSEGRLVTLLGEFLGQRDRLATLERHMGSPEALRRTMAGELGVPPDATAESILAEACADHAFDAALLRRAGQALLQGTQTDQDRGETLLAWLDHEAELRASRFETCKEIYLTGEGEVLKRLATKGAVTAFPDIIDVLGAEARRIQDVLDRIRAVDCLADSHALTMLALDIEQRYRRLKVVHAALDYDDLILKARDLLLRPGIAPWVLYKLDGGIDHILVDEAQDTNHQQWDLIKALTEEFFSGQGAAEDRLVDGDERRPRTIFAVGDRKQSIFSFQGAEPEAAAEVRDFYAALLPHGYSRDPRPPFVDVPLDTSFRSTGAVLKLVDAVINGPARDGVLDPGQMLTHGIHRRGQAGLVELWPRCQPIGMAEPEPWAPPQVTPGQPAPDERLAQAIAAKIADMVGRDRLESKDRLVRAGDIMVLVRSRDPFVLSLVRALKGKNIAVSGIDRLRLLEDIAVMDLMAFADFLLMPEDDLNLAALLKSPLFDISEADVLRLCADRGTASVWSRLNALAPESLFFREAADLLGRYLAQADFNAPFALFADLLSAGGGRKRIHARLGAEADEAIDEFLNLALAYAQTDTPSLQGFLHWIRSTAAIVKRELGNADVDQVRIMTVHGAKGLQAPIVFLADKPNFDNRSSGLFWVAGAGVELPLWSPRKAADVPLTKEAREGALEKRREETNRLLYVALTRAEDRLYVCGRLSLRKAPENGWHEQVAKAFEALPGALQAPLSNWPAPTPIDTSEGWIGDYRHYQEPQAADPETAQERPTLAVEDQGPPGWARTHVAAEPDPPRPLIPSRPSGPEPAVISPIAADQGYRFKRGLLIHRLLELLPAVPDGERRAAAERYLRRRVHGLAAAEADDMRDEVLRILDDPELGPLFGPQSLAEVPVVATLRGPKGGTEVLTGQIDRLLVRERDCIILDYKSNRPAPMQASQVASAYLRQLAAYKAAIAAVYPGKSIACKILWTAGPTLMDIPASMLSGFAPST